MQQRLVPVQPGIVWVIRDVIAVSNDFALHHISCLSNPVSQVLYKNAPFSNTPIPALSTPLSNNGGQGSVSRCIFLFCSNGPSAICASNKSDSILVLFY